MVYLDYAASGLVREEIANRYAEYCRDYSLNPHGGTAQAEACRRKIQESEHRLLQCLGIRDGEAHVLWTSGGTEALNLAIRGSFDEHGGIFVDAAAHPAMLHPSEACGNCCKMAIDGEGRIMFPENGLTKSSLVCVCHANNESGAVQDLLSIRHQMNVAGGGRLLVDAAQSFGKLPIPWRSAGIDLLAVSSRKIGGPASVGALIVRNGIKLRPLILGGGQQGGLRSGTVDTVGVMMFADAAEMACAEQDTIMDNIRHLNELLWEGLKPFEKYGFVRLSPQDGSPYIASFAFKGYEGAVLKRILAQNEGIVISTGSACSAESGELSHVFRGMGFDDATVRGALRVSFGHGSQEGDVIAFLAGLKRTIEGY
ncbi:MAG: aminotransferase class V-fold PLP-dependent enzyme [Victivallales bacterium]|nr:aminotransferase class V-fold PLP-dependent enzyme [Victivallales bacterium]